jgi:hypothetical protein
MMCNYWYINQPSWALFIFLPCLAALQLSEEGGYKQIQIQSNCIQCRCYVVILHRCFVLRETFHQIFIMPFSNLMLVYYTLFELKARSTTDQKSWCCRVITNLVLTRPDLLGFLKNGGMEIAIDSFKKCSPCL